MDGLYSQPDIISGVESFKVKENKDIEIFLSNCNKRIAILPFSNFSIIELENKGVSFPLIRSITINHDINAIHIYHNYKCSTNYQENIPLSGANLIIGITYIHGFELVDEKATFSKFMEKNELLVVSQALCNYIYKPEKQLNHAPYSAEEHCIKSVTNIYCIDFWCFYDNIPPTISLNTSDSRIISPFQNLTTHARINYFTPQVLMSCLPGPEHSVNMMANQEDILAVIVRCKEYTLQYSENEGEVIKFAISYAELMHAEGVNDEVHHNDENRSLLTEINMYPLDEINSTQHSDVHSGLFAFSPQTYWCRSAQAYR
ncbi:ATP-grasp domain-containing protein [Escherichia albertii]|nr:ATP-grasp domain-containing protein [Escherichia albertii]